MNTFVPGIWLDTIDVNDFIKLNEKPFFGEPLFLNEIKVRGQEAKHCNKKSNKNTPKEFLMGSQEIKNRINDMRFSEVYFDFPISKPKNFSSFFRVGTTTSLRNSFDINIIDNDLGLGIPPLYFPDIRQIPLYGLNKLIKNKRKEIKKMEGMFQTNEWVDRKIELDRELEEMLKLRNNKLIPKKEELNIINILNCFLEFILLCISENPRVTFHLPSLLNFIDIFTEKNLEEGWITEDEAYLLLCEFYKKLIIIKRTLRERDVNFYIIETIFLDSPTKTSYKFLKYFIDMGHKDIFVTLIYDGESLGNLRGIVDDAIKTARGSLRFVHRDVVRVKSNPTMSHLGFPFISDEDVILFNKKVDIRKLLYLTINGGKDVISNKNINPIYQKFKDSNIDYRELFLEFRKMVSLYLTSFAEANNLTMYLADKYFYHPLRSTFKKSKNHFTFINSLSHIEELAKKMLALKNGNFSLVRNKNGFVTKIVCETDFHNEILVEKIELLINLLMTEAKKVPLYKNGKINFHFYVDGILSDDFKKIPELPRSFRDSKIMAEGIFELNSFDDILLLSKKGLLDIEC